jgi:hypothetical protein
MNVEQIQRSSLLIINKRSRKSLSAIILQEIPEIRKPLRFLFQHGLHTRHTAINLGLVRKLTTMGAPKEMATSTVREELVDLDQKRSPSVTILPEILEILKRSRFLFQHGLHTKHTAINSDHVLLIPRRMDKETRVETEQEM